MSETHAFSLAGYRALLEALEAGGYRFSTFEEDEGREGVVLLRHDVDKSPRAALELARIEQEHGITSTFFFLTRAPVYGLLEPGTIDIVREIASLGHTVGVHCDERRIAPDLGDADLDQRVERELSVVRTVLGGVCSPVVSFHNPTDACLRRAPATGGYVSAYAPRFMPPTTKYVSESNAHWREGPPHDRLAAGRWPRIQILVHPIWWARAEAVAPEAALREAFGERVTELDEYLAWSNDLWTEGAWTIRTE